jgi:hypothetical protein
MRKLIAAAFVVALVSSVQAMPLAPPPPDDTLSLVREACGAGMHRVNGVCVRTHARRAASRCARGVTCQTLLRTPWAARVIPGGLFLVRHETTPASAARGTSQGCAALSPSAFPTPWQS